MRAFALAAGAVLAAAVTVPWSTAGSAGSSPSTHWLKHVLVTEYFPAPERWFNGRKVRAPGLIRKHRVDWLYSGSGVAMEGDGVSLEGRRVHLDFSEQTYWIAFDGKKTRPTLSGGWTHGSPAWIAGGWRNAAHEVTYPLNGRGWSNGPAVHYHRPRGIRFARGPSRRLTPWESIAVDPKLIPLGSRVFVPVYCFSRGHAWFRAEDTGGAIKRRHIDVYRRPPKTSGGAAEYTDQRIYVLEPGEKTPKSTPTCRSVAGPTSRPPVR